MSGRRAQQTTSGPPSAQLWAMAALWAGLLAVFLAHVVYLSCVAEDAFITFRFAKHFAEGHGLVWNLGEAPVEGYTNFLWLLLCAAALKLRWDLPWFSQAAGVLASLGTLAYTFRYASRRLGLRGAWALAPCAFLAISGPFAAWASSGMETSLFGLLLLMGCYYVVGFLRSGSRAALAGGFFALLLATLTRPEGALVFGVLLGLSLACSDGGARQRARAVGIPALVYVLPFLAYFIWRFAYFGYLLPNTFYAKTGGGVYQYLRGAKYVGLFVLLFVAPLLLPAAALARARGARHRPGPSLLSGARAHIGSVACLSVCVPYILYIVYVGGDYMAMFRFFVPLLPLLYLPAAVALERLAGALAGLPRRRAWAFGLLACAAAATLVHSTPLEKRLLPKPSFMHGCYRGQRYERWASARFTLIGKFFRQYKRGPDESLALWSIGAISYYADMPVHSVYGLVDPHIAHRAKTLTDRAIGRGFPGHEKADLAYVLAKQPTYIMISKKLHTRPKPFPPEMDEEDPTIRDRYQLISVWLRDEANGEAGYFTFLELKSAATRVVHHPKSAIRNAERS